jgi:hypothetical protein
MKRVTKSTLNKKMKFTFKNIRTGETNIDYVKVPFLKQKKSLPAHKKTHASTSANPIEVIESTEDVQAAPAAGR